MRSVRIRRALVAVATFVVAIGCALAVPLAQLRTFHVEVKCCCPDPDDCHCPTEKQHRSSDGASMRVCHHSDQQIVAPQTPSFTAPAAIASGAPARAIVAIALPHDEPHPAPAPRRPDAPS
jgi:hypothetical protein